MMIGGGMVVDTPPAVKALTGWLVGNAETRYVHSE